MQGSLNYIEQETKINGALKKSDVDSDNHLAQLVTTALAGAPPGEIREPEVVTKATTADKTKWTTEGALTTTNGWTYKNYQYFWKFVCAFTKWIPTNQFLNAGKTYVDEMMTLERFGFIGTDKKCFWGMVGVKWITPLKVEQLITTQMKTDRAKRIVK